MKVNSSKQSPSRQRVVTCGKCGQKSVAGSAHNARSCGKKTPPTTPKGVNVTKAESEVRDSVETITSRNIFTTWENYTKTITTKENTTCVGEGGAEGEGEDRVTYSIEDLETLWLLKCDEDGKIGKGKSLYTKNKYAWEENWGKEEEKKLESFITEVAENVNVSPKTWHEFLKTLGAVAKKKYLKSAINQDKVTGAYSSDITIELAEELGERFSKKEPEEPTTQAPIALLPSFLKDPSVDVRSLTARLPNLPYAAKLFLVQDRRIEVLSSLAQVPDQSAEILVKIEERLEAIDNGAKHSTPEASSEWAIGGARRIIANHPNTPKFLMEKYLLDKKFYNDRHIRHAIYKSSLLSPEVVEKHRENLRRETQTLLKESRKLKTFTTSRDKTIFQSRINILKKEYDNTVKYGYGANLETFGYIRGKLRTWIKDNKAYASYNSAARALKEGNLTSDQLRELYNEIKNVKGRETIIAGVVSNKNVPIDVLEDAYRNLKKGVSDGISGGDTWRSWDMVRSDTIKYIEKVLNKENGFPGK